MSRPVRRGELLVSLGLLALGGTVLAEVSGIEAVRSYEQLGPRLFPLLVGIGLVVLAGVLGWQALSGGWRLMPPTEGEGHDWPAFGWIGAGLVLHMLLIARVGFVAASLVLFALVARGLGSRRWLHDAAIGLALAVAVFYLCTAVLDLRLPVSPLEVM